MKKQFMSSLSVLVLAMTLIFNYTVSAQSKSAGPTVGSVSNGNVQAAQSQNPQKQITRAQFMQMSGASQQEVIANISMYNITDLVNATPADLAHRQDAIFYIVAADFHNLGAERQWYILKDPAKYKIVAQASDVPKIEISKGEYDALPASKKEIIRNSPEYIIIN